MRKKRGGLAVPNLKLYEAVILVWIDKDPRQRIVNSKTADLDEGVHNYGSKNQVKWLQHKKEAI